MHALIKSEAYYLINDTVIRRWENKATLKRCADNLRMRLQCTGRAYTNIFTITIRENSAVVTACGYTFTMAENFVYANIEELLEIQHDNKALRKFLLKAEVKNNVRVSVCA